MGLSSWRKLLNTTQIKNDYSEKPAGLKWRSSTFFILATVAVGMFTDLFLYGLIVPILPFMLEDRVGVDSSQIQSYTSGLLAAYSGASVIVSPFAGILADKISTRQSPFLLGLSTLLGATILLFVGTTIPVLMVARVLQGVSSAFVWTIGLAICIETVGPANLGKATGAIFSFTSVGSLFAPFLGGLLYEKAGYHGVLGLCFGVLGLDFAMRILIIEKKVSQRYEPEGSDGEDGNGSNTNGQEDDSEAGEANDDEEQPLLNKDDPDDQKFILSDKPSKITKIWPIWPCLSNSGLLTALWLALVQATFLGSCDATIATVSRELFNFGSLKAGVMFLPLGITDAIFGPIAGWAVDRYGTKPVSVITFVFLTPMFILLRLPHAGGIDQIILYGGLLALLGVGLSAMGAPSIVESGAVMDKFHKANPVFFGKEGPYASLYGMNSMMFNLGLTIGPELAGELKGAIGYGNMNIVLAALSALTAFLSYLYIGGKAGVVKRSH